MAYQGYAIDFLSFWLWSLLTKLYLKVELTRWRRRGGVKRQQIQNRLQENVCRIRQFRDAPEENENPYEDNHVINTADVLHPFHFAQCVSDTFSKLE